MREIDPITLRPTTAPFRVARNGVMLCYDAPTLLKYVYISGDTRDPVARQTMSAHELKRLFRMCHTAECPADPYVHSLELNDDERRSIVERMQTDFVQGILEGELTSERAADLLFNLRQLTTDREYQTTLALFQGYNIHVTAFYHPPLRRSASLDSLMDALEA